MFTYIHIYIYMYMYIYIYIGVFRSYEAVKTGTRIRVGWGKKWLCLWGKGCHLPCGVKLQGTDEFERIVNSSMALLAGRLACRKLMHHELREGAGACPGMVTGAGITALWQCLTSKHHSVCEDKQRMEPPLIDLRSRSRLLFFMASSPEISRKPPNPTQTSPGWLQRRPRRTRWATWSKPSDLVSNKAHWGL